MSSPAHCKQKTTANRSECAINDNWVKIKTDNQSSYPWKSNIYSRIIETYESKGCVSFCVLKFSKLQKVIKACLNVTFKCLSTYTWDLHRAEALVKSQRVLRSLANLHRMHLAHQLVCFVFSTNSTLRRGGMYSFKNGVTIALNDSGCQIRRGWSLSRKIRTNILYCIYHELLPYRVISPNISTYHHHPHVLRLNYSQYWSLIMSCTWIFQQIDNIKSTKYNMSRQLLTLFFKTWPLIEEY